MLQLHGAQLNILKPIADLPCSVHLSPWYPAAQLHVSFATQTPFSHGGSHTTGARKESMYAEANTILSIHAS